MATTTTSPQSASPTMDDRTTSILVRYTPSPAVTKEMYDETMRRLAASGEWMPEGLEYHVAFGSDGDFRISEVWDSREQFDAFRKQLMPVPNEAASELSGEPEIFEIHSIEKR